jgi:hypothetical protein
MKGIRYMSRAALVLAATIAFVSCGDQLTGPSGPYYAMSLERKGAGDLAFTVAPTVVAGVLSVSVTHREFRDTSIVLSLVNSTAIAASVDALTRALGGEYQIKGDFKQSSLPTGTWVRVYLVQGAGKEEVTNVELRESLLSFEGIVRSRL